MSTSDLDDASVLYAASIDPSVPRAEQAAFLAEAKIRLQRAAARFTELACLIGERATELATSAG